MGTAFSMLSVLVIMRYRVTRSRTARRAHYFLGLDFSTQSLTTIVIEETQQVVYTQQLVYDAQFPQFGTRNGVLPSQTIKDEVLAPSLMFICALDRALRDIPPHLVGGILAVSGSAQQHGSMFWKRNNVLSREGGGGLDSGVSLEHNFHDAFLVPNAPIWMDSSTTHICEQVEAILTPQRVAEITGSRAYARFTGNQIAKVLQSMPHHLLLHRISLLSSGLASVLLGDTYAPIDMSDGSGMNMMDVRTGKWSREMMQAYTGIIATHVSADGLRKLLGDEPCASCKCLGSVHDFFVSTYGFRPSTRVIAFTGDNPSTVAGLRLSSGDVAISFGTSTTLFALTSDLPACSSAHADGHFFRSPLRVAEDDPAFMAMICFKNGALPRKDFCDKFAQGSWEVFHKLLMEQDQTMGQTFVFAYPEPEITPTLRKSGIACFQFEADDAAPTRIDLAEIAPAVAVRGLITSQCLGLRQHYAKMLGTAMPQRLIVTGGASVNDAILQVLANVFQAPVYVLATTSNSAALGAALRAKHGFALEQRAHSCSFYDVISPLPLVHRVDPAKRAPNYLEILARYSELERRVIEMWA